MQQKRVYIPSTQHTAWFGGYSPARQACAQQGSNEPIDIPYACQRFPKGIHLALRPIVLPRISQRTRRQHLHVPMEFMVNQGHSAVRIREDRTDENHTGRFHGPHGRKRIGKKESVRGCGVEFGLEVQMTSTLRRIAQL